MTEDELGRTLRNMYDGASAGEKVVNIHLFGVKYAAEIVDAGSNASAVVRASGLRPSYAVEVAKGMRLAPHVTIR